MGIRKNKERSLSLMATAMEADFDPDDKYSWYFGQLSRDETNKILEAEAISGVFLVRESKTMQGDFVLCVKEDGKVSHYIINRIRAGENAGRFRIGDKDFPDICSLLNFYKTHYLETTTLIRPAPRTKLLCRYNFPGRDPEDLPFKRDETLELICKYEAEWWTARNANGQVGQIPVRYVQVIEASPDNHIDNRLEPVYRKPDEQVHPPSAAQVQLPAKALVTLQRIPSAYDRRQLRLEVGQVVTVLEMNLNGQWEGEIDGKRGIFPFTHVRFLTQEELNSLHP